MIESPSELSLKAPHAAATGPNGRSVFGGDLFPMLLSRIRAYLSRRRAADHFLWNVPPKSVRTVRPETVYCVELPATKPEDILRGYIAAGVAPDHVVFAGDPETLTYREHDAITRKGALVHDVPKKSRRAKTEQDLAAYFAPASAPNVPLEPRPYTYTPAPPQVTAEQLQGYVDAIARRSR